MLGRQSLHDLASAIGGLAVGDQDLEGRGPAAESRPNAPATPQARPGSYCAAVPLRCEQQHRGVRERGAEPLTIYINFDGGDMTLGEEDDAHTDTTQIEALVGPFPALEATEKFKFEIVDAVRRDWSTLGVVVVAERPPPTREYVMCMVGPREFPDATSVLGIAPVDASRFCTVRQQSTRGSSR